VTNLFRTDHCYLVATLCLSLGGCAGWTGPLPGVRPATTAGPPLPSDQLRPVVRGAATTGTSNEPTSPNPRGQTTIVRGQQPSSFMGPAPDEQYSRQPMTVSGAASPPASTPPPRDDQVAPAQFAPSGVDPYPQAPSYFSPDDGPRYQPSPAYETSPGYLAPPAAGPPIGYATPGAPGPEFQPGPSDLMGTQPYTGRFADLIVNVREQQTGRFMFGVGVNSDAGLTAQIVMDEYNFDWRRFPHRCGDIINGTAWRGGGQRLRIEAIPGSQLQRYLVNFTEPYLFDSNISLNLSGFLYDRDYFDWDEQRLGGRIGLGYRLTPDLSITAGMRLENVNISDPRVRNVQELNEVIGDNALYSGRLSLTHDTRDSPFAATEGHLLEIGFEQVFGTFEYPRGTVDYRRYFLLSERPDGSGRHTLGTSWQVGISGSDTPLYENFFAGGYSTLRGFRFRSANPKSGDVFVGGEFSFLGSVEYMFPITADDMMKGVVFCDYGTIEEEVQFEKDDFRVALGAGLRIAIPAMGPAPIALDFAIPVAREETDRIQNFSFFVGFGR
jgi:outer membrane protein insertion porin family